jgi:hypothetical protein
MTALFSPTVTKNEFYEGKLNLDETLHVIELAVVVVTLQL